jgi:DNA uptake protein ComE-like DNA-binding protein
MKSHFTFSKQQRNGIFLLFLVVILLQCAYFYLDLSSENIQVDNRELLMFQKEIDSLKRLKLEESKQKVYPFNPNYITDFKGATLGMSNEEIDRLLAYRKQDKWINSIAQFQEVTQVSDSLLDAISPYFNFPEWVIRPKPINTTYAQSNKPKTFAQKQDLNTATEKDLQRVNGIGEYYSKAIIKLRNTFPGGFIADVQLQDVYGLKPEVIKKITNEFTVKTPRAIKKINLNKATIDELVTIQHIDYETAQNIVEQRLLREGFKSINELTKVKDFPINKFKIIELYLHLEKEN